MNALGTTSFRCGFAIAIVALLLVATPRPAGAQTYQWEQRTLATHPSKDSSRVSVYDTIRERIVVACTRFIDGTWTWDGAAWTQVSTNGPEFPEGIAFDSAHGVAVVHSAAQNQPGETWLWNGSTWQLATTNGPVGRAKCAMAYDTHRQRTMLFGGGGVGFQDLVASAHTWEWDGAQWRIAAYPTNSPPRRWLSAAVYDAARRNIVLFGGSGATNGFADTWVWDGATWTEKNVTGPGVRAGHKMTYDPVRERVLLFGSSEQNDVWEWDGTAWTVVPTTTPPPPRFHVCFTYDEKRRQALMFGGVGASGNTPIDYADTWVFQTPSVWTDAGYVGGENGTFVQPFNTLAEGITAVPVDGTVRLKTSFPFQGTISKPLTLFTPFSPATVGP